jgi:flagellar protein FliS
MKRAYNAYAQNNTMVQTPEKLIEMLYEGILKFSSLAKRSIENKDAEKKVYYINRTTDIYIELISSLRYDTGGTIADYLNGLYMHQIKLLSTANLKNSTKELNEVINVVTVLLEAWREETKVEPAVA